MLYEKDREQDGDIAELNARVDELNKKVDALNGKTTKLDNLDAKMDKIAENSEKMVQAQEKILQSQREQRAQQILQGQVYNPTGFFAHQMVQYLMGHLEKYQTTNFRRWLSVSGGKVVELNIAQYVNSKISMMQWYDTKFQNTDETHYRFTSKSAFPFEINTGVPFVGKLTLTKVLMDISGDVDTETRETTNMKCNFCADQKNRQIFQDFEDDLVSSLKPHKTSYTILRPFGMGIKKLYRFMATQLTFSIPFVVLFLATLILNWIPFAQIITDAAGVGRNYWGIFGITASGLLWGLVNGLTYGLFIFIFLRFHIMGNLQKGWKRLRGMRKKKGESEKTEEEDDKTAIQSSTSN